MTKKSKGSADEVDKYVGTRLREVRLLCGVSQEKLAETIDLTFQQIQKYERGTNRLSASRLYQLATVFQVPIAYFYEGLGSAQDDATPPPLTRQEANTVRALRDLSPDWRNLMARHIAEIASIVEGNA